MLRRCFTAALSIPSLATMVASLFVVFYWRCRGIHPAIVSPKKEIQGSIFLFWLPPPKKNHRMFCVWAWNFARYFQWTSWYREKKGCCVGCVFPDKKCRTACCVVSRVIPNFAERQQFLHPLLPSGVMYILFFCHSPVCFHKLFHRLLLKSNDAVMTEHVMSCHAGAYKSITHVAVVSIVGSFVDLLAHPVR